MTGFEWKVRLGWFIYLVSIGLLVLSTFLWG